MSGRAAFHPFQLARRGTLAVRLIAVVFALLTASFFRLQILEHDEYALRAESNRLRPLPMVAPRGLILDRHGLVIAENVPGYSVSLLASSARELERMLGTLRPVLTLDTAQVRYIIQRYRAAPYEPALVVKDADFELVSALEERRAAIPGLVIQTEPKRFYPDSTAVAHLVGYVGEATEQELAGIFRGRRLGATVGKTGLERQYEDTLAGSDGVRFIEVDALGRVVREEGAQALPSVQGDTLRTTIDLDLQRFIAAIYPKQYRGAMVAMDPRNGAILALYSNPAYNPNDFVGGVPAALWETLTTDPAIPLLNRAIGTRYPPASTFKLATALLGLREGIVTAETHMPVPCRGGLQIGNRYFRCWRSAGHGSLDLIGAVAASCDVYFYQLGLRLTVANMSTGGTDVGFGQRTGIDLPNEITSLYPSSTAYYDRVYGRGGWTNTLSANLAIGQGENAQTLINMVRFYAALGNGGHVPTPFIVRERTAPPPPIQLDDTLFLALRRALIAVVERGTARGSRLADIRFAGKTGTAQNPHGDDHGWFIGFAPADEPRIVVGGIFEFGLHGTTVAPYVARAIEHYLTGASDTTGRLDRSPLRMPVDTVAPSTPLDSPRRAPRAIAAIAPVDQR